MRSLVLTGIYSVSYLVKHRVAINNYDTPYFTVLQSTTRHQIFMEKKDINRKDLTRCKIGNNIHHMDFTRIGEIRDRSDEFCENLACICIVNQD